MMRASVAAVAVLFVWGSVLPAADDQPVRGTIARVDVTRGTVTVRIGGRDGREFEKTFRFGDDTRATDEAGKDVSVQIFRPGDRVRLLERDGKLRELRRERRAQRLERKEERRERRDK